MNRYQHVLVCLAADRHDPSLIRYAGLVARMAQSRRVTFAHVEAGDHGGDGLPDRRAELEKAVQSEFDAPDDVEVRVEYADGAPLDEVLHLTRTLEADLLLVGQGERGAFAEKLARQAPCSVLVLPLDAPEVISRVLVPVDFSEHAADAVDVAAAFAEAAGLGEVHLLHVYGTPEKGRRSYESSTYALRRRAEEACHAFLSDVNLRGLEPVCHFAVGLDVPEAIERAVAQHEADLLVIGTRGRTPGAAVLLGSVAEALVHRVDTPVVAVKRKGVTLKLLEALLERSASRAST